MRDADIVQRSLDMLEHDYAAWAMQSQQNILTQLIESFKQLECDVSIMLSDCIFLGRQYWKDHNLPLIDSLHQSFTTVNTLCNDLKAIRLAPSETHINPSEFQQLVIDWGRLKKSIDQTQSLVQHPQKRRKNHAWFSEVRQSCGGQPGVESVHPAARESSNQESAEPFQEGQVHKMHAFSGQRKKRGNNSATKTQRHKEKMNMN